MSPDVSLVHHDLVRDRQHAGAMAQLLPHLGCPAAAPVVLVVDRTLVAVGRHLEGMEERDPRPKALGQDAGVLEREV